MPSDNSLTDYQKSKIKHTIQHELDEIESAEEVKSALSKKKVNPTETPLYAQLFRDPKKIRISKAKTDGQLNLVSKGAVREYIIEELQTTLESKDNTNIAEADKESLIGQFRDNKALLRRDNAQRGNDLNENFTSRIRTSVESVSNRSGGIVNTINSINRRLEPLNNRMQNFRDRLSCSRRNNENDERHL